MRGNRFFTVLILCVFLCPHHLLAVIEAKDPYDNQQLQQDLMMLKKEFGDILQIQTIGRSMFGKPIQAVQIGKGMEYLLFVGAHHGREWISANLLMMMIERYARHYRDGEAENGYDPKLFDRISLVIIPMLNPDGIDIQQGKIPPEYFFEIWLMNEGSFDFSRWKANAIGIDLNRQYPAGWKALPSPSKPYFKFYKGETPLIAKEVIHLVEFVKKQPPLAAVSFHSAGQEIYWAFGERQDIARDLRIGKRLSRLTGYPLASPPRNAVGGGFTDWFIDEYSRPGFTIELCTWRGETNPDITELPSEFARNRDIGYVLIEEMIQTEKKR